MSRRERFSQRRGLRPSRVEIVVRDDAPAELREAVIQIAQDFGFSPTPQRKILCRVLRVLPDQSNWSEYPNIWYEVQHLILECEWYYVYDYIEVLFQSLLDTDPSSAEQFASEVNRLFEEQGIGWQLIEGVIEIRGPESFEAAVSAAKASTESARPTANSEIHEALSDLSRRPDPDLTGAVHHAMAALECVARDVTGKPNATLGEILKQHPELLPKPLDAAYAKLWGFASEFGRHVREGQKPESEDVELVVGLAASAVTYLAKKYGPE